MEVRYRFVFYAGLLVAVLLGIFCFFPKVKSKEFREGKKVTGQMLLEMDAYMQKKIRQYKVLKAAISVVCLVSIMLSFVMLARPSGYMEDTQEKYQRDIFLCMDVSSSVNELNKELVTSLQDTVKELNNERFGISIFNTSSVVLTPLTDDYAYITEELEQLRASFELRDSNDYYYSDDWYTRNYVQSGVSVGNEERGSSLIGDGLASCALNFEKIQEKTEEEENYSRIIIFTTDNELAGEPIMSLEQAAQICQERGITVYGIGTSSMEQQNKEQMQQAVESTGGKFYQNTEENLVDKIVENIEKEEKNKIIKSGSVVLKDQPKVWFALLSVSLTLLFFLHRKAKI